MLTRPGNLRDKDAALLGEFTAACPEMTALAKLVREFAALLTPVSGNATVLTMWITDVRAADLPYLHAFTNGRTEGVNTRTKGIMRQTHGRTGFPLLRQRILLQ